jgi:hypothetical protein
MLRTTAAFAMVALCGCGSGGGVAAVDGGRTNDGGSGDGGLGDAGTVDGGGTVGTHVNGTVKYSDGTPGPGLTLLLTDAQGTQTQLTSDGAGTFSAPNVAVPYSLAVVYSSYMLPGPFASLYLGLRRADPQVVADDGLPTSNRFATLQVTFSGGTYPQPATDYVTYYSFASPQAAVQGGLRGEEPTVNDLDVSWLSPSSTTTSGTLQVLQVQTDAGLPVSYSGYGMTSASLTSGSPTSTSLQLAPVSTSVLTGSVAVPSGFILIEVDGYLVSPSGDIVQFLADTAPSPNFSYATPSVAGTTIDLQAFAVGADGPFWVARMSGLAPDASGVDLSCPSGPTLIAPPDNQNDVTRLTQFSWSPSENSVYRFTLFESYAFLSVWTADTALTLPDLSSVGFGPLVSSTMNWQVYAISPYDSLDALSSAAAPLGAWCEVTSPAQTFTTSATP